MYKIGKFPWYVPLLSIYPASFYWGINATQIWFIYGLKFAVFSFAWGMLIWGITYLFVRNLEKSSIITFLIIFLFWSFGHIDNVIHSGHPTLQPLILASTWAGFFFLGVWWIKGRDAFSPQIHNFLNLITAFLVVYSTVQIVPSVVKESRNNKSNQSQALFAPTTGINEPENSSRPDIYYIILDAYTREDIFKEYLNYDNSEFISQLEGLGFFVARCSKSNYSHTHLSLSSSLNYRYLDEIFPIDPSARNYPVVIKNNAVRRILEGWGYKTVAFETGHLMTELTDADVYYSRTFGFFKLTEFDLNYLETSLLKPLMKEPFYITDLLMAAQYRARVLFVLDKLAETPKIEGPKFIFAHILAPHPPHVFGPNGEAKFVDYERYDDDKPKQREMYKQGYVNQSRYINKRILEIVKQIIDESTSPPIIVMQGDHGPSIGKEQVTSILNAYYLPGETRGLYDTISPVNSFRLVFDNYFGQDLQLEEDISRWSSVGRPLKFEVIPNNCQ
ncbi:MAG TPA: sulfatase-like hydrolase/transferase [Anaerolineales bacterium]|nr:sulfatase-like hydrolase/transferase [Anaerolineales bacterium]